ncbi:hypothetical protein WJX81_001406 [Elliptochloris bilobata]|uniref:PQ-loop repeat-containing protein 2 n=1 Tax=Elliptochloris bilobata TaxID=381761 RepID=A0AAW1S0M8_9CHLO
MSPCAHGAYEFFEVYFNDCVYNARDAVGFAAGVLSIGAWLVAQMPQIVSNCRNRSADALSAWFLAEWLLGDTCNLIGLLLVGDQLPTMTYTAMYFICMDTVLIMQYIYYGTLQRRRERARSLCARPRPHHAPPHHRLHAPAPHTHALPPYRPLPSEASCDMEGLAVGRARGGGDPAALGDLPPDLLSGKGERQSGGAGRLAIKRARGGGSPPTLGGPPTQGAPAGGGGGGEALLRWPFLVGAHPEWARVAGMAVGWVSSAFYVGSRVSQIVKNAQRRSAEGLALSMFAAAICANCLYGAGILLRSYSAAELLGSAPWLLGSLGTVALDMVIFVQGTHYARKKCLALQQLPGSGFAADPARSPAQA